MKLVRYECPPTGFTDMNRLFESALPAFDRMSSLFEPFFGSPWAAAEAAPATDLYEDDTNFYVRIELPGVKKDQITLEIENAVLSINANRVRKTDEGEAEESYTRSLSVPECVDPARVEAHYEDGILTITLPKQEARKPRRIDVR